MQPRLIADPIECIAICVEGAKPKRFRIALVDSSIVAIVFAMFPKKQYNVEHGTVKPFYAFLLRLWTKCAITMVAGRTWMFSATALFVILAATFTFTKT